MADDALRRSERDVLSAPRNPDAQARRASARVRAGETPPALRTLDSLERVARRLPEFGARLASLAELAWARLRLGETDRAIELALEAAAGPPLPARAQPDLSIRAVCRAGATLCRAGDEVRGRDLLSRAGHAVAPVESPWGELGSVHAGLILAVHDAWLGPDELTRTLPGLERVLTALAQRCRGQLAGSDLAAAVDRLGLAGRVASLLRAALREPHTSLWERGQGVRALERLHALDPDTAAAMVEAAERVASPSARPGHEDILDRASIEAVRVSLRAGGEEPEERLLRWIAGLEATRLEEALLLRAALGHVVEALEDARRLIPAPARTRVLEALLSHVAELEPASLARNAVDRACALAPAEARELALVHGAAIRALSGIAAGGAQIEALARRALRELERGTADGQPRWLLLEPLALAAERGALVDEAAEAARAELQSDIPAAVFHALLALARCAGVSRREEWLDLALSGLVGLVGQDVEDAATVLAGQLGAHDDAHWRAEGLARVAAALEPHPGVGGGRHMVEPIARIAAALEPP